jgi:cold shock protein
MSGTTIDAERFIGRVKWFNNKAGYGFITITDGAKSGTDVFVHHSTIQTGSEQYVYLVQGEYVEFQLAPVTKDSHEFQAGDVRGVKGGKLMCETRREFRIARNNYKSTEGASASDSVNAVAPPKSVRPPTRRGPPPAKKSTQEGKWTKVGKRPAQK